MIPALSRLPAHPWDERFDLSRRGQSLIQLLPALRADPMGKLSFRMGADLLFDLRPISAVVAYLFAPRTNQQQSPQSFNIGYGISQLFNELLALLFQSPLLSDFHFNAD